MKSLLRITSIPKAFLLRSIRLYQRSWLIRQPLLKSLFLSDAACRFTPTCSEYSYQAIDKYGTIKGLGKSLKRILRCHPFNPGGYDPVK